LDWIGSKLRLHCENGWMYCMRFCHKTLFHKATWIYPKTDCWKKKKA
jgi:hypothetical protein